ncbi:hypothetical protein GQX73_g2578 [Xylaria multiplex]|uniref:SET domain-containing protein n=1 Tax=Xylaria multiplex TaxID=323545 RepID=A0A7C8IVJ2_9PEZI|nr:hypothetical protein GQX73_g2578 [Xylaria multiplex]
MPLGDEHPLAMGKFNPPSSLRVTAMKPTYEVSSDSSGKTSSSTSPASQTSSGETSSYPTSSVDKLSSTSCNPNDKAHRNAPGPRASLRTHTSQPEDVGSKASFADWDGKSLDQEANRSTVGSMFHGSNRTITPNDSVSMRNAYRKPYLIVPDTSKKSKYEDRLTRLGYVERLSDIDGKRHYRIVLDIDKELEEDRVHAGSMTISLSSSNLFILNKDGLQPKLASDLEEFNNGLLQVKKSPISGFGVFAVRDLERLTPVLIERELFNANSFDLYQKLDTLTKEQMIAYQTLHGHQRSSSEDIRAAIWRTNRFSIGLGGSVFLVGSRFNHACKGSNNVDYSFDWKKRCMVFVTQKKVPAGSELFIRYGSDPHHLFLTWGFRCACGHCTGITEEECEAIKPAWGEGNDFTMW